MVGVLVCRISDTVLVDRVWGMRLCRVLGAWELACRVLDMELVYQVLGVKQVLELVQDLVHRVLGLGLGWVPPPQDLTWQQWVLMTQM
jgi:hypothetical protein